MSGKWIGIFIVMTALHLIASGAASAENSLKKDAKALSFGVADGDIELSGRLLANNDLAVLAGFGFSHTDNDANATDYSLSVGGRKYLGKGDLAPFVGADIFYDREEEIGAAGPGADVLSIRTIGIDGHFGLEYFFAKTVSAEAAAGVELSDSSGDLEATTIGTFRSAVSVNFYLP